MYFVLFHREDEEWSKLHKVLAPKMLRPRGIIENLENFNGVTRDAIEHLLTSRGLNGEVPDLEGEIPKYVAECEFCLLLSLSFQNDKAANIIPLTKWNTCIQS